MKRSVFTFMLLLLCVAAQPQVVIKRCKTCKKPVAQCRYNGRHAPSLPAAIQQLERDMVFVEGGTFTMGATPEQGSEAGTDEKPAHEVTLSGFHICRHEVTQAEWEAVMGSNPSEFKGANRPVERVSWDDCQTFIRKLNAMTGKQYRLPTEAEWEYAARGGQKSQGYKYSGSNTLGSVAWYDDNSGSETHPVMTKQANELGLYDMTGNVWEWCSDWYGNYSSAPQTNPKGSSSGSYRVSRGGSGGLIARYCRVPLRGRGSPDCRYNCLGLRLAL
ncbi:MAG: formylglycine-generating enzyme family protein [Bacteroidaceae bacterium]|nr:formylglycine-generating enzyme family protein [Bacteroidaceae bacterium]